MGFLLTSSTARSLYTWYSPMRHGNRSNKPHCQYRNAETHSHAAQTTTRRAKRPTRSPTHYRPRCWHTAHESYSIQISWSVHPHFEKTLRPMIQRLVCWRSSFLCSMSRNKRQSKGVSTLSAASTGTRRDNPRSPTV